MAIRFPCASCQQPIEIDDQWAGQPVACPYCRRVVSAPRESAWPGEVPMASPAGQPLVPPAGAAARPPAPSRFAMWAIILSLSSVVLFFVAVFSYVRQVTPLLSEHLGPTFTLEDATKVMQQLGAEGKLVIGRETVSAALAGLLLALLGLSLGVRALIARERHRITAVFACIIGLLFIFCQGLFTLNLLALSALHSAKGQGTQPAIKAPHTPTSGNQTERT